MGQRILTTHRDGIVVEIAYENRELIDRQQPHGGRRNPARVLIKRIQLLDDAVSV